MNDKPPDYNDVRDREAAWRTLAHDLFVRLSECRLGLGPKRGRPPLLDELEIYAARFRSLSQAAGWSMKAIGTGTDELPMKKAPPKKRKPWWKFW